MTGKLAQARSAAFFAFASVAAGVLHYLFQVWSVSQLSLLEFGELNSWIAYFSIALSLGAFAQYSANFFIASPRFLRISSWIVLFAAIVSLVVPWKLSNSGGVTVAIFGVVLGILFSWCIGQAQARLAFIVMGIGVLGTGVAKFVLAGVSFPVESASVELAWAVALSYSPALIWVSGILLILGPKWSRIPGKVHGTASGLTASAILSFASVYIPQMDIIAIHQTQAPEQIGEFARISLLYKAVFFSFLILAQWLLPHQLATADQQPRLVSWMGGSRWRVLSMAMILGFMAFLMSVSVGPLIMPGLREQWLWILLSCLNMVWLTNLFFSIQLDAVEQNLKSAGFALAALGVELVVAIAMKLPITQYLIFAGTVNAALWFFFTRDPHPVKARTA
jgi:hypothetical protein